MHHLTNDHVSLYGYLEFLILMLDERRLFEMNAKSNFFRQVPLTNIMSNNDNYFYNYDGSRKLNQKDDSWIENDNVSDQNPYNISIKYFKLYGMYINSNKIES